MAKAIVDPEDLRRFAHLLKHFTEDLSQQMQVLQGQFSGLGDTWRDQEHEKFASEFTETMQVMSRFVEAAGRHVPFLLRKADRIDDYLHQR